MELEILDIQSEQQQHLRLANLHLLFVEINHLGLHNQKV